MNTNMEANTAKIQQLQLHGRQMKIKQQQQQHQRKQQTVQ